MPWAEQSRQASWRRRTCAPHSALPCVLFSQMFTHVGHCMPQQCVSFLMFQGFFWTKEGMSEQMNTGSSRREEGNRAPAAHIPPTEVQGQVGAGAMASIPTRPEVSSLVALLPSGCLCPPNWLQDGSFYTIPTHRVAGQHRLGAR